MAEIKSTNKYLVKRKYKTINGTTYPMDEYQVILYEEDSEDCGYIRPQYQWIRFVRGVESIHARTQKSLCAHFEQHADWGLVV